MAVLLTNSELRQFCELGQRAARAGGAVLLDWAGRFETREKAPADLVTDADVASQEVIRKLLLDAFPDHEFLGEEGMPTAGRGPFRWIVDPLDATMNYVHQLPNFCVSIALEHAGVMVVGVVYDPSTNECFRATLGGGAWLDNRPLRVSQVSDLSQALVAASFPAKVARGARTIDDFIEVLLAAQGVRRLGSAALNLCYLAAGRFDAYWATDTKLWDVAAGMLMIHEAGGLFTAIDGTPFDPEQPRFLAASTPNLHQQMRQILGRS